MHLPRRHIGLTAAQRTELWDRWKQGESLSDIAKALAKYPASIYAIIRKHGGTPPRPRIRSARHLSLAEREEISRGLAADDSLRTIATRLGRAPATISREIDRNGGAGHYRAANADDRAWQASQGPKASKLATNPRPSSSPSANR